MNTKTVLLACAFQVHFVEKRQPVEMAALQYLRCCIDVKHRPLSSSKHVSVLHYYTCAPSRGIEGHKSFQHQKLLVNNRNSFQLFWWLYYQLCSGIGITTSHLLEISHSLSVTDHRMVCYHQFEHVAHIFLSSALSQQRQIEKKSILVNPLRSPHAEMHVGLYPEVV